ncbi:MAG: AAA domain-containing protein [Saprospiraceae bacterium]
MQPESIDSQIKNLQALLKLEKEADFERFRKEVLTLSLTEKKKRGLTWHPLTINKQGYTVGDRAFLIVERSKDLDKSHRFKSGAPIELYSLADDKFSKSNNLSQSGVIHFVDKKKMKVILNSKDFPDWLTNGQLGVDLLFDERTYLEMEKVLKLLLKTKTGRLSELKAIFFGALPPTFSTPPQLDHAYLNKAQIDAVANILAAEDLSIVHGPPGTGKTTTLVHAIKLICEKEKNVMVTAPSNAAVDLLVDRLSEKGLNVVRIGNISRVDEKLIALTLEGRLADHPESKNIKKVRIQAAQARREAKKFKRNFGHKERAERKDAYQEARELEDWARLLEDRIIDEVLHKADVIACTLVNATHSRLEQINFRTVVIDEAGQALEPACWIPVSKAHRVVLAGDPFQLPPTVKSKEAQKKGFAITLLERSIKQLEQINFLDVQYRMNENIMQFSNQQFYDNQLKADVAVAGHSLGIPDNQTIQFVDTAGCGFTEIVNPETGSRKNEGEFFILREHFLQLIKSLSENDLEMPSIAVIAPYREQVVYLKESFEEDDQLAAYAEHVDINTIDAFQGQERDVIYITLVRSNEKSEIGFLSDYRRMNVAMTRARKQLVIIGDSATVGNDKFYGEFITYTEEVNGYRSAWEFMS